MRICKESGGSEECLIKTEVVLKWAEMGGSAISTAFNKNRSCIEIVKELQSVVLENLV